MPTPRGVRRPRREQYEGYSFEQSVDALGDDVDELEFAVLEHIDADMAAHAEMAGIVQEWKLASLKSSNRMLRYVVGTLATAFVSLLIALATTLGSR